MRLKKSAGQQTGGFFFIPTHPAQKMLHLKTNKNSTNKISKTSFQQTFVLL